MASNAHQMVDIPRTALVRCPKAAGDLTPVQDCVVCPAFAGLGDRFPGSPHPFRVRYQVRCHAEPINREILILKE